jgi:hypothetical protein
MLSLRAKKVQRGTTVELILVLGLIGALAAAAFFASKAYRSSGALRAAHEAGDRALEASRQADEASADLGRQVAALQEQVQQLSRYQTVLDAEAAAAAVRAQSESWAAQARAQAEASAVVAADEARAAAARIMAEARAASNAATVAAAAEAARIVAEATRRAEETAGVALDATLDARRLEQTAQAMKNAIEGYGDRYVVPTTGLLDDLAEEFGVAEGGQRLKAARDRVRAMIKLGTAATCDDVEAERRTTAIAFVLDAFNGKIDTILSDVRRDNLGTLQQKIRDAFTLVNHNGRAFRDARILRGYLDARLDELRWAVIVNELKAKERGEQKPIKDDTTWAPQQTLAEAALSEEREPAEATA